MAADLTKYQTPAEAGTWLAIVVVAGCWLRGPFPVSFICFAVVVWCADKISKIQKSLDDVKDIMSKNIEDVLKRGETLDSLMEKSADLSTVSVQFYKKAKKTNQCCQAY
jgi:hypothetical protein